jgi:hypothetical protein
LLVLLLLGGRLRGGATAEEAADGVADGGADCDTAVGMSVESPGLMMETAIE